MIKYIKKLILVKGSIFILVIHFKTVSSIKVKKNNVTMENLDTYFEFSSSF